MREWWLCSWVERREKGMKYLLNNTNHARKGHTNDPGAGDEEKRQSRFSAVLSENVKSMGRLEDRVTT